MKLYYIIYEEKANINYCFLFSLFLIAERGKNNLRNLIVFNSMKELSNTIKLQCNYNISVSTISRIFKDENYIPYFSTRGNEIELNNNFKSGKAQTNKFITLNEREIYFLLQHDNKLLNKYYLYLKYYCGYNRNKSIDSTANQILFAIGYSNNCGNNKNQLCIFNQLLLAEGFISIKKIKDERGYNRNIYSITNT